MDLATIAAVRAELGSVLIGQRFGRVFQLAKFDLAIDFRLSDSRYLFLSLQPGDPRAYLIKRRLRDLEKASINPAPFLMILRRHLSGAVVSDVAQIDVERVLIVSLDITNDLGESSRSSLAVQLTGNSANLFLLDSDSRIVESIKETKGEGQLRGDRYRPPSRKAPHVSVLEPATYDGSSISEKLDREELEKETASQFDSLATAARTKLKHEIAKRKKLVQKLNQDLGGHGDPEQWKRFGDLLLANVATARRDDDKVFVIDYFDPSAREIAIEVDANDPVTTAAEKYFKKYTKARNAASEIQERLRQTKEEITALEIKSVQLEALIEGGDEQSLIEISGTGRRPTPSEKRKRDAKPSGVRTFISSDGIEILVGKKAKDNDFLTFRTAKSLDTWMHAADYPGSHVVIRNPNRKEIPTKTLVEAAQLAAFYSRGKSQPKAAVNYTQKKFVNKPKGAAPGLVSLASFKTLLVEPKIGEAKLKTE